MFSNVYTVAIIDDCAEQRRIVERKLKYIFPEGVKVEFLIFDGSREFEEKLLRADFYVVDFEMPGKNGCELVYDYRLQGNSAIFTGNKNAISASFKSLLNTAPIFEKPADLDALKAFILEHYTAWEWSRK